MPLETPTDNPIPAIVFGVLLVLIGIAMLVFQKKQWSKASESAAGNRELQFHRKRFRRRGQIAGLIILIGVMIPVGDSGLNLRQMPVTFSIFWLVVMGLALWVGLLAIGDLLSARLHLADEINKLHRERLTLGQTINKSSASASRTSSPERDQGE